MDEYRFSAIMGGLRGAQAWIVNRGRAAGLPDADLIRMELACEEILANIILHAYPDVDVRGGIEIHTGFMDQFFAVTITDEGIPFNPLEAPEPDINRTVEDRRPGGLGIHFVRAKTDQVRYSRIRDRNILTLKWVVPLRGGGAE